jgi:hypothetical protein
LAKLALIAPEKGGANLAFFLTGTPGIDWEAGRFYSKTNLATRRQTNRQAFDDTVVEEFWHRTQALLGIAER